MDQILCLSAQNKNNRTCLEWKNLDLDDWLKSVKNGRTGDIMYVYLLSMMTSKHCAIHLKGSKIWWTLKVVPFIHAELLDVRYVTCI